MNRQTENIFVSNPVLGAGLCCGLILVVTTACMSSNGLVLESDKSTKETEQSTDDGGVSLATRNRSALGFDLAAISDWSTAYPFVDLMKHSREWYDWDNGIDGFDLDGNGWVRSLGPGQNAGTVFLVTEEAPVIYNRIVVTYDGKGKIEYDWKAQKLEEESTPGRDVVLVDKGNHLLRIVETDPDDYLRNIAIVPEELQGNHANGEVFNPVWLDRLEGVGALRFSNWMQISSSIEKDWEDRPQVADRTWALKGVPLEIMIKLANRVGADPWFTVPHLATDTYVREMAGTIRQDLSSPLRVYVEHSHRPFDVGTKPYLIADQSGRARWGEKDDAFIQWHGVRTAEICDIYKKEIFQDSPSTVKCVMSMPNHQPDLEEALFSCPYWVAEEAGREPCYRHGIDLVGISGFFDGCLQYDEYIEQVRTWFGDGDGGMARGMEQLRDSSHLAGCQHDVASLGQRYSDYSSLAASYGLALVAYEGGARVTGGGHSVQEDPDFIDFYLSLNRHSDMGQRYRENFTNWYNGGGRLYVHYVEIGQYSKFGSPGGLEYVTQETSPKWESLMEFINKECWWDGC